MPSHLLVREVDVPGVECRGRSGQHLPPDGLQSALMLRELLREVFEETLLAGARPVGDHALQSEVCGQPIYCYQGV